MKIEATLTWTDETEAPRFSLAVDSEDFGKFRNLPDALTAAGFVVMEKIEPTPGGIASDRLARTAGSGGSHLVCRFCGAPGNIMGMYCLKSQTGLHELAQPEGGE